MDEQTAAARVEVSDPVAVTAGAGSGTPPLPPLPPRQAIRSLPAALLRYYHRWFILARPRARGREGAARAERWSRSERRYPRSADGEAMARIDYWTAFFLWKRWPLRTGLSLLVLPLLSGVRAFHVAAKRGGAVRAKHGHSVLAQALEIWLLALRQPLTFGSDPGIYYLHELFRPGRRGDAPFLFANLHHTVLTLVLNGRSGSEMRKDGFAARCAELNLPHIPAIASIARDGSVRWFGGATSLPPEDLFSKPAAGMKGVGAARWLWQPGGRYRAESGALLDAAGVMRELRTAARRGALLVQRRVANHPRVEALVGSTLATVRIVSLLSARDGFEPVLAIHRSAPADAAVDNAARGGVACAIALRTGELGEVMWWNERGVEFSRTHPRTGAPVEGARLPFWPETLALVERAHRGFGRYPVLGWDVALTAGGPVLVEANPLPGAESLQAAHRLALGRQPYAGKLLELIEARVRAA